MDLNWQCLQINDEIKRKIGREITKEKDRNKRKNDKI
jgi:hypothetical protein